MTSETPKIDDFDSYCLQIFALVDGSEFLIGFGPLQNPTPQIGYPYAVAHGVPQIGPYLPPVEDVEDVEDLEVVVVLVCRAWV